MTTWKECKQKEGTLVLFPKTSEFDKQIPKKKFYENLTITPALKRCFVEQIKGIRWQYKLAPSTLNISAGREVTEIEVFRILLNGQELDEAVLRQIDREIPYHILFILESENKVQAWIGYKEAKAGGETFKVSGYYHTGWVNEENLHLRIEGLSTDDVYAGFVRQIAGEALNANRAETLKESVDRANRRQALQKQIAALQSKVRKEKQLNKQVQLNAELKRLKKELEGLG